MAGVGEPGGGRDARNSYFCLPCISTPPTEFPPPQVFFWPKKMPQQLRTHRTTKRRSFTDTPPSVFWAGRGVDLIRPGNSIPPPTRRWVRRPRGCSRTHRSSCGKSLRTRACGSPASWPAPPARHRLRSNPRNFWEISPQLCLWSWPIAIPLCFREVGVGLCARLVGRTGSRPSPWCSPILRRQNFVGAKHVSSYLDICYRCLLKVFFPQAFSPSLSAAQCLGMYGHTGGCVSLIP